MKLENAGNRQRLVAEGAEQVVQLQNPKTSLREQGVEGVVLHYTAVRAPGRPAQRLEGFRQVLGAEHESVAAFVAKRGSIPSALMLSLNNAANPRREASWDFTVGKDGLVVQCNLELTKRCTWHAGRRLTGEQGYVARHGNRNVRDYRGALVYDGASKTFAGPRLPSGKVMQSGNPPTIGIELESWGRLDKHQGMAGRFAKKVFHPIGGLTEADLVQVGGAFYERIPDVQYEALLALCRALRDFYELPDGAWFGHRQITPDRRTDPDPPLDMERLVRDIYADRIEVVAIGEDEDPEDVFVGEPLPDNAAT